MTAATVIAALDLPADARVDQRVPKKLLVENGAPAAADKRQINDGIEELLWVAVLKPASRGVPVFRDDAREYLEIAVLTLTLRPGAKAPRLAELVHRAIPYPVFLIQTLPEGIGLSLSHLRWSRGQSGQTVLDGPFVTVAVDPATPATGDFLASLRVASQPRQHLHALYQGWIERCEAYTAARLTGRFTLASDRDAAERRRAALTEHGRLTREIRALSAQAARETQLKRRVELNLQLKVLEARIAEVSTQL
jgi:hypothetical protein